MPGTNATKYTRPVAVRLPHAVADLWDTTVDAFKAFEGKKEKDMVELALELIHRKMEERWGELWANHIHNFSTVVDIEKGDSPHG